MTEINRAKLAQFLINVRKTNNLSLDQMGDRLHVSGRTIRRWENAEVTPTMDDIMNICNIFNLSLEEIFNTDHNDSNESDDSSATSVVTDENIEITINNSATNCEKRNKKSWKWILVIITVVGLLLYLFFHYAITHNQTVSKEIYSLKTYRNDKVIEGVNVTVKSDGETLIIAVFNSSNEDISFFGTSNVNPELYILLSDGWHSVYKEYNPVHYLEPPKFIRQGEAIIITADCIKSYGGILAAGKYCLVIHPVGIESGLLTYLVEFTISM